MLSLPEIGCCCAGGRPDVTPLDLGEGVVVGLCGLKEALARFRALGSSPSAELGQELLAAIRAHNYVPATAEERYKLALLREYAKYLSDHS